MARVLLTWELGGGLGHVTALRPVADALAARGHRVLLATRDLAAAATAFAGSPATVLQAPVRSGRPRQPFRPPVAYAQLLHNVGFERPDELATLTRAWCALLNLVRPDLIVCDHSPFALLASRGGPARRVLLGTGFYAPPAVAPLPRLRAQRDDDAAGVAQSERRVLDTVNAVAQRLRIPALQQLADLYGQVDANLLTTFPELDHFGPRPAGRYFGVQAACPGQPPEWPTAQGRRVFAYLKATPGLDDVLQHLAARGEPTLVYGSWVNDAARRRFQSATLRLTDRPVELAVAAATCDAALLNGTHGATAELLLAGKPIVQLPIHQEQFLVARNTERLGAGILANRSRLPEVRAALDSVLDDDRYRRQAAAFAERYPPAVRAGAWRRLIDTLARWADPTPGQSPPPSRPAVELPAAT